MIVMKRCPRYEEVKKGKEEVKGKQNEERIV